MTKNATTMLMTSCAYKFIISMKDDMRIGQLYRISGLSYPTLRRVIDDLVQTGILENFVIIKNGKPKQFYRLTVKGVEIQYIIRKVCDILADKNKDEVDKKCQRQRRSRK